MTKTSLQIGYYEEGIDLRVYEVDYSGSLIPPGKASSSSYSFVLSPAKYTFFVIVNTDGDTPSILCKMSKTGAIVTSVEVGSTASDGNLFGII